MSNFLEVSNQTRLSRKSTVSRRLHTAQHTDSMYRGKLTSVYKVMVRIQSALQHTGCSSVQRGKHRIWRLHMRSPIIPSTITLSINPDLTTRVGSIVLDLAANPAVNMCQCNILGEIGIKPTIEVRILREKGSSFQCSRNKESGKGRHGRWYRAGTVWHSNCVPHCRWRRRWRTRPKGREKEGQWSTSWWIDWMVWTEAIAW